MGNNLFRFSSAYVFDWFILKKYGGRGECCLCTIRQGYGRLYGSSAEAMLNHTAVNDSKGESSLDFNLPGVTNTIEMGISPKIYITTEADGLLITSIY